MFYASGDWHVNNRLQHNNASDKLKTCHIRLATKPKAHANTLTVSCQDFFLLLKIEIKWRSRITVGISSVDHSAARCTRRKTSTLMTSESSGVVRLFPLSNKTLLSQLKVTSHCAVLKHQAPVVVFTTDNQQTIDFIMRAYRLHLTLYI